ncbi:Oidioi.mRNA.OKI2018_I69.PAR.g8586.t1.cds [Oikopleura dioica]|uniref:Oidioi.mRNA.OKI2018_I69.PAR.g8586.t1.cds n=1 Tax=Oikopleura dioica TaxID=34765 RepID=A0ABN7RKM7_OIKDI|nr:Oidioi.mRNA.OKI2018_I69.PAR.g8586.t1.cds [Oikopleura dioica]
MASKINAGSSNKKIIGSRPSSSGDADTGTTMTTQELRDQELALAFQEAEMRNYSTKLSLIKLQKRFPNMPKEQLEERLRKVSRAYIGQD